MPDRRCLYIKNPSVDSLLDQYLTKSGAPVKTKAIRRALSDQLKILDEKELLAVRVARIQGRAEKLGFASSGRGDAEGHKRFMNELWGEE